MDNVNETMQDYLRPHLPWTAAEREALAQVEARNRAEDQRRLQRAVQDQQQHYQNIGVLP
ncbi:hypothetical protein [Acidovorax sp. LjRoot117]|uniref:hypothetical protein n=1 Tax=Acidovorax sp. LjRoot117 TaxID=3342255 RepID=UPI003ECC9F55